jgi:hypothetical protein
MRTQNRTQLELGPYHTGFWYGKIAGTIASAGGIYALSAGGILTLATSPLIMLGIFSGCIGYLAGGTVGGFVGSHMAKSITFNAYEQRTVQANSQNNENIVATQAERENLARETMEQIYPKAQSENREISAICGTAAGLAVAGTAVAIIHYCSSDTGKKTLGKIGNKVPDLIDRLIPEPTKKGSDSSPPRGLPLIINLLITTLLIINLLYGQFLGRQTIQITVIN